jgi:ABC-type glutathione transport system ATPase component
MLNLIILPTLALHFGRFERSEQELAFGSGSRRRLKAPIMQPTPLVASENMAPVAIENALIPERVLGKRKPEMEIARAVHHSGETTVRIDGLSKSYGRIHALAGVGFSIRAGEILGLIGPNGAGKTTLFECIAGLEPADQGDVYFGPAPVDGLHRSSRLFYIPDGRTSRCGGCWNTALGFSVGDASATKRSLPISL